MLTSSIAQDLLLVGGGHSHTIVLQMWAMQPLPGVRLTLVSDRTHTPYSGMLPGHVAGFYDYDACHIDLRRLCAAAGAQFFLDSAIGIDPEARLLFCADHPALAFDWLSLDIGSTPAATDVPGAAEYAVPAKPVPELLAAWEALIQPMIQPMIQSRTQSIETPRQLSLGIVGGGVGGVELAIAMRAKLNSLVLVSVPEVHLFQGGPQILPQHNRRVRRILTQVLAQRQIHVHVNTRVKAITPNPHRPSHTGIDPITLHHSRGTTDCDRLFWVTQASAPTWIAAAGLATDERGFVLIGATLQSVSHPHILAAGDIATLVHHPRPKAGVFAVRQGRPLFENLRCLLQGLPPKPFTPQRQILALIGTGDGRAVASRGRWSAGPWRRLWRWKDRIDRQFMQRFCDLPPMPGMGQGENGRSRSSSAIAPLPHYCAGCGAKVGKTSLDRVLHRLRQDFATSFAPAETGSAPVSSAPASIVLGLDAPDDAAVLQIPSDRLLVQTLDYFEALVSDPFIFGQITANHCLNDIFAMGAVPHSALALVQVPRGSDAAVEAQLYQLLSGAMKILSQSQTALIGGHTTEGDTLAFGLSCNGLAEAKTLWRKGGMQPGNQLILTKALGTGTLFAAQMRGQAKGRWIDGAIASMVQSNAIAVEILRRYQVTACTDVTGFGLVGHLAEMVQASGHSVRLEFAQIPWLEGATTTVEQNLLSSLHAQNLRATAWISNWPSLARALSHRLNPLNILFDPQTSGGLLAALPMEQADACVAGLQAAGFGQCRSIGTVLATDQPVTDQATDQATVPVTVPVTDSRQPQGRGGAIALITA
ncbi:MAG: selenide, water dikinase SelD [Synechococcales cyanobacterium CRU_2_2]|nr:selenide, water dikinase SelD [Synechococcales cyanobacterium CRU_2_2]